jgi:hypothetical protein
MSIVEPERKIPVIGKYDVIVAGGGPSGTGAAIAAARNGANTLLIERYGFLGGMYTAGFVLGVHLDKTYPIPKYEDEKPLLGGVVQEMMEKLVKMRGTFPPHVWAQADVGGALHHRYIPTDPEMMKIALMEMIENAGAEQLLHAYIAGAVAENNEVKGVIIESKSGRQAILADLVIDCTGDGDVAVSAGAPWERAPAKDLLPMTLNIALGGIDPEKLKEYKRGSLKLAEMFKKAEEVGFRSVQILPSLPDRKGVARPLLPFGKMPAIANVENWKKYWQRIDETPHAAVGNIFGVDCSNVEDLTKAELATRKGILRAVDFMRKHVPGFENCYVSTSSPQIGIRESRRITGGYVLTWNNDAMKSRRHADAINQARVMGGPTFDIPYRCLVPRKIDGLLTAGRCISVDHELARGIAIRDEQQAMALGQASGTAAALAIKARVRPRDLDVPTLQDKLREQGLNLPKR